MSICIDFFNLYIKRVPSPFNFQFFNDSDFPALQYHPEYVFSPNLSLSDFEVLRNNIVVSPPTFMLEEQLDVYSVGSLHPTYVVGDYLYSFLGYHGGFFNDGFGYIIPSGNDGFLSFHCIQVIAVASAPYNQHIFTFEDIFYKVPVPSCSLNFNTILKALHG